MMEKAIFDAIKELSNKIDNFGVELNTKMDKMDEKFTTRMDKMYERMDNFEAKLEVMDTKFTRQIAMLASDVDGIKKSLEYIKIEQSALRTGLETLDAKIEARIDALEERNEAEHQIFREALQLAN